MPKGTPLTEAEKASRRQEIFNAVVHLILEKGFQETSMREISETAGMGKSSLYDYFKTKDEILLFVLEEQTILLMEQAQKIAGQNIPVELRLKQIMEMHLDFMQANKNLHSRLIAEAQRLKLESQRPIQEKRYAYQDLVAGLIQAGIQEGCFRDIDARLAARLLLNSLLSIVYTTRPSGSPQDMLEEAVEMFLNGIKT